MKRKRFTEEQIIGGPSLDAARAGDRGCHPGRAAAGGAYDGEGDAAFSGGVGEAELLHQTTVRIAPVGTYPRIMLKTRQPKPKPSICLGLGRPYLNKCGAN